MKQNAPDDYKMVRELKFTARCAWVPGKRQQRKLLKAITEKQEVYFAQVPVMGELSLQRKMAASVIRDYQILLRYKG